MLKVREHSELLSAQYLARCLEPGNVCHSITTRETPKRRMKETLFTRHRNTVEPMMLADNRKEILHAIHTDAVNKAVRDQKKNIGSYKSRIKALILTYVPTAARRHITSSDSSLAKLNPTTLIQSEL